MKRKKRILVILRRKDRGKRNKPHFVWIDDCREIYDIDFWGKDICDTSLSSLKKKIDSFKPDFLYFSLRKKYQLSTYDTTHFWLPDLTTIKVPKIFVEVDSYQYDVNNDWYKQFDKLYCRCSDWGNWKNIPVLKWSVSEIAFPTKNKKRNGIFFVGTIDRKPYFYRRKLRSIFEKKITFCTNTTDQYWDILHSASALLCPAEGRIEKDTEYYIPAKLFEYLASGAAVLTNCDISKNAPELNEYLIRYQTLEDLESKLSMDFSSYYNKAIPEMRKYTHRIRYKELFG